MAIKYLDAKRIRGSSTSAPTPTFSEDFSSDNWDDTGSKNVVSGGSLSWNYARDGSHHKTVYDLGVGNVSNTAWTLRFEMTTANSSAGGANGIGFIGIGAEDEDATASGTNTSVQLMIGQDGTVEFRSSDEENLNSAGTLADGSWTNSFASVATKYVEITKLTTTTAKTTFYTDNTFGTVAETGSGTIDTTEDLRYIFVSTYNASTTSGAFNGTIDNMKFYNGITDTSEVDEKATLVTAAAVTTHYLGHNEDNMAQNGVMGVAVNSGSSLIGKEITKVSFWARYINGATNGTLYCRAWDSSGNVPSTVAKNFGSIDGSTLTSSMAKYTFTIDSGTYTIAQNSHIGLEYSGSANNVEILGQNSGGAYGTWFEYDGSYSGSNGTKTPNIEVTESATSDLPENTLFDETDTYKTYWLQSNAWTINDPTRGVACMGDNNGNSEVYDFVTIATLGNATDFGNCTSPPRFDPAACADATRGVCFGGGISASQNIIEYITVATEGNATDFGDMTAATRHNTGMADATYGLSTGGYTSSVVNSIDYVTIQTLGNAADFGNLSDNTRSHGSCADATRGLVMSGYRSALTLSITYLTIASTGNSTTFGDVTVARQSAAGCADATRGICGGGVNGSQMNIIDYVTIQSTGNATDFGDLTVNKSECAAYANALRGCFAGGNTGSITDVIEYVTIQTLGNAADFGDSTEARRGCEGLAA
jgi:hypothetical protein